MRSVEWALIWLVCWQKGEIWTQRQIHTEGEDDMKKLKGNAMWRQRQRLELCLQKPRTIWGWSAARRKKALSVADVRGRGATNTLTLGFWPPEPWDNFYSSIRFVEPETNTSTYYVPYQQKRHKSFPTGRVDSSTDSNKLCQPFIYRLVSHHHHQLEQLP